MPDFHFRRGARAPQRFFLLHSAVRRRTIPAVVDIKTLRRSYAVLSDTHVNGFRAPYAALAVFAVPLIILEPVKPIAAYLAATGHFAAGATVFVVGEISKLILIERLS